MCSARCLSFALASLLVAGASASAHADGEVDDPPEFAVIDPLRFTRADVPNVAASNLPGRRTDLTTVGVERWVSSGRAGVGFGVGRLALLDRRIDGAPGSDQAGVTRASASTLMLGLRYRATDSSSLYAHATNVRGLGAEFDERVVGKVGIEFKAAQSKFGIDYGGLGMRLAGDARMTVKLRRGGVGIFMRSSF